MNESARLFLDNDLESPRRISDIIWHNVFVAAAYILTGYLGLQLAFIGTTVTLFWPPSGIAFAALWIGGRRLLPSIFFGALVVNFLTAKSLDLAAVIALGNTASAVSATYLMRRRMIAGAHPGELQRVMAFILLAVLAGTMVSATIGTATVSIFGQNGSPKESVWLVWWMGDAMGVLIVAPPILLWRRIASASKDWRNVRDALGFVSTGFCIIAGLAFIHNPIWAVELCKLFTLLLSLWAGARFGLNGPAAMTLLMAGGAVGVTALGIGPFARGNFYDSFALVHSYLFAEAVAGMLLAAALADLRRAVDRERDALGKVEAASANRIRLMSMISHDLRTPMAGIMGSMQTLDGLPLAKEEARLVAFGLRAANSLMKLIGDILDVARVDTGQMVLSQSAFSPAQSLEDVVATNRQAAFTKSLDLRIELAPSLPQFVEGDRVRFEQIIANLVSNAITHTEAGHVLVSAEWADELIIDVIDTGLGITADLAPHIFDAFIRTRPQETQGLGLGLHICRQLTQLMNGNIAYHQDQRAGSRFRVNLPLPPTSRPATPFGTRPKSPAGLRILLIDDDEIARETTSALLTALGHFVTLIDSAEAVVELVIAQNFDIVLTDMHFRGSIMQGLDCVRAIRALPPTSPACVIIALTGNATDDERALYLRLGCDAVLIKPLSAAIDLTGLLAKLRTETQPNASGENTGTM